MPPPKNWSEIKSRWVALLERRTGAGIEAWNERVRSSGHDTDEATLRSWLTAQGVAGYPRQLLVMERFGYPDFLTAGADELIEGQYRDRPGLRPVRPSRESDRLLTAPNVGNDAITARAAVLGC